MGSVVGAFSGSQVSSWIHFMPTWLWNVIAICPAAGYGLAFSKERRVAAFLDHDEAVCAVRNFEAEVASAVS